MQKLLALNHQLYAEEQKAALLAGKKAKGTAAKINLNETTAASSEVTEPLGLYQKTTSLPDLTTPLFGGQGVSAVIVEKSRVTLDAAGKLWRVCLLAGIQEGGYSGSFQNIRLDSPLAQALLSKQTGDTLTHEGKMYKIVTVFSPHCDYLDFYRL